MKQSSFPKRFKTTSRTKFGKDIKSKMNTVVWGAPWGSPWAPKRRSEEGLKNVGVFVMNLTRIYLDCKSNFRVFYEFVRVLKSPPNQHNMYKKKRFSEKATCAETT